MTVKITLDGREISAQDITISITSGSALLSPPSMASGIPPPAPTNVVASNGAVAGAVALQWAASPGTTSYTVHRASTSEGYAMAVGTTDELRLDDLSAVPGVVYWYSVRARNAAGVSAPSVMVHGYASEGVRAQV
jgi:fibronectin type 3 domain-containing protein